MTEESKCLKISEMVDIVKLDNIDLIPIFDVSTNTTKSIAVQQLIDFIYEHFDLDNCNQSPALPPPPPEAFIPTIINDRPVCTWSLKGFFLDARGGEHTMDAEVSTLFGLYYTDVPHNSGGSNGLASVLSFDEAGEITLGQPRYSSGCSASLCGVIGYRIDSLIPHFCEGTTGVDLGPFPPVQAPPGVHKITFIPRGFLNEGNFS